MNCNDPWCAFSEAITSPWNRITEWKGRTGGKVIGHLLPDVPEEIIHAAGALPVALKGAGVHVSRAQAHIPGYTCSHAMGLLELGLSGNLDVLDGMVIPYTCDTTRNLFHIWDQCFPQKSNQFLRLPKRVSYEPAKEYLKSEYVRFAEAMGGITGNCVDEDRLWESIDLYDRTRVKLGEAINLYRLNRASWTAHNVFGLIESSMKMPREDHLDLMAGLPWNEAASSDQDRIPIYVKGKIWDPPGVLSLLDELGFVISGEEILTGSRYTPAACKREGNPFDALVNRHFSMIPYAGYHVEPKTLTVEFVNRVASAKAAGVVFLNPKFCEAAGFDTPDFQKALEGMKIPSLILETSARGVSVEQVRLRLEAFREMIAQDWI